MGDEAEANPAEPAAPAVGTREEPAAREPVHAAEAPARDELTENETTTGGEGMAKPGTNGSRAHKPVAFVPPEETVGERPEGPRDAEIRIVEPEIMEYTMNMFLRDARKKNAGAIADALCEERVPGWMIQQAFGNLLQIDDEIAERAYTDAKRRGQAWTRVVEDQLRRHAHDRMEDMEWHDVPPEQKARECYRWAHGALDDVAEEAIRRLGQADWDAAEGMLLQLKEEEELPAHRKPIVEQEIMYGALVKQLRVIIDGSDPREEHDGSMLAVFGVESYRDLARIMTGYMDGRFLFLETKENQPAASDRPKALLAAVRHLEKLDADQREEVVKGAIACQQLLASRENKLGVLKGLEAVEPPTLQDSERLASHLIEWLERENDVSWREQRKACDRLVAWATETHRDRLRRLGARYRGIDRVLRQLVTMRK